MDARRRSVAVVAVVAVCLALVSGSGAGTGGLRVVTQFRPPRAGQIELIAVVFKARFSGSAAPVHPLLGVTLPGAGPPHGYGFLSGERLTHVRGNVATYVWLSLALKPSGAKHTHDQPLIGQEVRLTPISNVEDLVHTLPSEFTIDTSDEAERAQFGATMRADGVSSFSAASFAIHVFDDGTVFHWLQTPGLENRIWNESLSLVSQPHSSTAIPVGRIEVLTGYQFIGGPSSGGPTLTGRAFAGSIPGTVDVALTPPGSGINVYKFVAASPDTIKSTYAPQAWSCLNTSGTIVECKGPTLTGPFTTILGFTGTSLPSLTVEASSDGGKTWGPLVTLGSTTPTPTATPTAGSLSVSCPSSVTQGQSIQITITGAPATAPVKVTWTPPAGSPILHTAILDSTNPTIEHDAIGTNESGVWKAVVVSAQGQTADCVTTVS